jgi:single-strand DNA-binding protein
MLNKVVLIGRLTADPVLRYTATSVPVCTFTLAVDRPWEKDGEKNVADFIPIVTWRKTAEACEKYISQGSLVAVAGRIQVRSYVTTKTEERRYITEIIADEVKFLSRKNERESVPDTAAPLDGFEPTDERIDEAQEQQKFPGEPDDLPF